MIERVTQRTSTDCFRCAIAMAMRIKYEEAPELVDYGEDHLKKFERWLRPRGFGLMIWNSPPSYINPAIPVIVQARRHYFVVFGREVIDPHEPTILGNLSKEEIVVCMAIVPLATPLQCDACFKNPTQMFNDGTQMAFLHLYAGNHAYDGGWICVNCYAETLGVK